MQLLKLRKNVMLQNIHHLNFARVTEIIVKVTLAVKSFANAPAVCRSALGMLSVICTSCPSPANHRRTPLAPSPQEKLDGTWMRRRTPQREKRFQALLENDQLKIHILANCALSGDSFFVSRIRWAAKAIEINSYTTPVQIMALALTLIATFADHSLCHSTNSAMRCHSLVFGAKFRIAA